MRRITVILTSIILIFVLSLPTSADILDQAKVKMTINVPAMQELEVKEPVAVVVNYPWPDAENGQAYIKRNVGNIVVKSNVNWILQISEYNNSSFKVYIRNAGEKSSRWKLINGRNVSFSGKNGISVLSFDIKIEADNIRKNNIHNEKLRFSYTLTQQ